ncbi:DNA gyrase inhibitor YacG [Cognatishimia sp. WU-CL00825]|uniref:DNA gyrase inhibitor YacG n=1 Tax=Cognatishimia sp. WU-CL00825 TaxID=3127658 RepID=UPI00336538C5
MSCPICKKTTSETYRPFCSKRCADIDLGKWLSGGYTYPTEPEEGQEAGLLQPGNKDNQLH